MKVIATVESTDFNDPIEVTRNARSVLLTQDDGRDRLDVVCISPQDLPALIAALQKALEQP